MRGKYALEDILAALRTIGGYFTFRDEDGEDYVIIRKQDVGLLATAPTPSEVQLSLPPAAPKTDTMTVLRADDLLERINRDIAVFREQQAEEDVFEDLAEAIEAVVEEIAEEPTPADAFPPPRRVRFEPLRGDLPPDLQE